MQDLVYSIERFQDEIRPAALKAHLYKCDFCGAGHRRIGYFDLTGTFVECDDHMTLWAVKNGFKVYRVHLQVVRKDGVLINTEASNLKVLCPRHALLYNRLR